MKRETSFNNKILSNILGSGDPGSGSTLPPSASGSLPSGAGMDHDTGATHHGQGAIAGSAGGAAGSAGAGVGGSGGPGGPGGMHVPVTHVPGMGEHSNHFNCQTLIVCK